MSDHTGENALSRVGCHCWGTDPASVEAIPVFAEAGCRWMRATRPMQMDVVAKAPGRYDFEAGGEHSIDRALEHGLSILGILDGRWGNETGVNRLPWASPIWEHLDEWAAFVTACVERYRGRVRYWEVLNEPPFFWWYPAPAEEPFREPDPRMRRAPVAHYAAFLRATARAVRAADPDARLAVGAGFQDGFLLRQLYERGCRDCFDIATVHYLDCRHPEAFERGFRQVRRVMAEFGDADKPLWDTENGPGGAVIGHAVKTPAEYQGLYAVYRHCLACEHGLERYFWFNPVAHPEQGGHDGSAIVTRTPDGRPGPVYRALRTLLDRVGTSLFRNAVHLDREVHVYRFDGKQGPISILWSTAPASARISGSLEGVTWQGEPVRLRGDFELSGRPLLLDGDLMEQGFSAVVRGKRETVAPCWENKREGAKTLDRRCPRVYGRPDPETALAGIAPVAGFGDVAVPSARAGCGVPPVSVPAELKLAFDEESLYVVARTRDGSRDPVRPTGLVLFTIKDADPAVEDWPYFTNGYGLFALFASRRGPLFMRYEHRQAESCPPGVVECVRPRVSVLEDGLLFAARIPWRELGPVRPGKHEPVFMNWMFSRADNLLDLPADDRPEEWPHNFLDPFILKEPSVQIRLCFDR